MKIQAKISAVDKGLFGGIRVLRDCEGEVNFSQGKNRIVLDFNQGAVVISLSRQEAITLAERLEHLATRRRS